MVAPMTPAKPRPLVVPVTSTRSPTLNVSTAITPPTFSSANSPQQRKLAQQLARFDTGFREMPRLRLRHARRAPLAERHLDRGVAVGLGRLDLCNTVVGDVEHCHRDGAAVVSEDARHPDLASYQSETFSLSLVMRIVPADFS